MNSNNIILIILGLISSIMMYSKLNTINTLLLIILVVIGFGVSRDYIISISFGLIITYIFTMLYSTTPLNIESFNKEDIDENENENTKIVLYNTILKTIHNLNPSQIDTFIQTMNSIKPLLSKGKEILNIFNNTST